MEPTHVGRYEIPTFAEVSEGGSVIQPRVAAYPAISSAEASREGGRDAGRHPAR